MKTLAIDTANQALGVAICQNGLIIGEYITNLEKNHSVRLMPAIDQLMKDTQSSPDELEKIIVSKGPGSYTGVRIGLSTAKSLAWALDIPIVGVSSLEVLAYQGLFFDAKVCPFFDARRNNVFTGVYHSDNGKMVLAYDERNISMEEWLYKLKNREERVLFLSPDIAQYTGQINGIMGNLAVIPDGAYHIAKPSHLVLAGSHKKVNNTHTLTPNYLRLAEAEAKWLKSQKRYES